MPERCVHAETLYTGREVKRNVHLVFRDTRVAAVSRKPRGACLGSFPVVTPALVDPHCHIGMHRAGEPDAEGETNDERDSVLPLADALDSIQMDDRAFASSVEAGVLYSCATPGSGNLVGGRTAVIRNWARNTDAAFLGRAGLKGAMGYNPMAVHRRGWKGTRPTTRMGGLAILREKLTAVRTRLDRTKKGKRAKDAEPLGPEEAALAALLQGRERFRVHAHKTDDILAVLRLAQAFGINLTIEHACGVNDIETFRILKRAGVSVVYGPLDAFAYKVELRGEDWRNLHLLIESGVDFGLMTDHPVVLQETLLLHLRWFLRAGYTRQQAIELVTRRNAALIGLGRKAGVLRKGMWASFVGWSGDPFDLGNHPVAVYGEGQPLVEDG